MHRLPQSLKEGGALAVDKAPALQRGPQAAIPVASASLSGGTAVPRPILPQSSIRQDGAAAKRGGGAPPGQGRAGKEDSPPFRGGMPDTSPSPWCGEITEQKKHSRVFAAPPRSMELSSRSICHTVLQPGGPTARLKPSASRPERALPHALAIAPPFSPLPMVFAGVDLGRRRPLLLPQGLGQLFPLSLPRQFQWGPTTLVRIEAHPLHRLPAGQPLADLVKVKKL